MCYVDAPGVLGSYPMTIIEEVTKFYNLRLKRGNQELGRFHCPCAYVV